MSCFGLFSIDTFKQINDHRFGTIMNQLEKKCVIMKNVCGLVVQNAKDVQSHFEEGIDYIFYKEGMKKISDDKFLY